MAKPLTERQEQQRSRTMLLTMHKKCEVLYECNTDDIKQSIEKEVIRIDRELGQVLTFDPWWEEQ